MRMAILVSVMLIAAAVVTGVDRYRYVVKKGEKASYNTWTRERRSDGTIVLTARKGATGEFDRMICDEAYNTVEWYYENGKTNTRFHAVRKNGSVEISGAKEGSAFTRSFELPSTLWYQFSEFAFSHLLATGRDEAEFAIFWPHKFSFYTMKMKRKEDDTIVLNATRVNTAKIRVSLTGFMSIFWSSDYWFRIPDYLFVRYEGVNGPPGTPETIMELVNEEK